MGDYVYHCETRGQGYSQGDGDLSAASATYGQCEATAKRNQGQPAACGWLVDRRTGQIVKQYQYGSITCHNRDDKGGRVIGTPPPVIGTPPAPTPLAVRHGGMSSSSKVALGVAGVALAALLLRGAR